jgi:hypothetical protein
MKDQFLYILAFKDEPLIKVGLAYNIQFRSRSLGPQRFDFRESYLVRSKDQTCIRTLERNIKTFFAAHQVSSETPLANGNTETFRSEILPAILETLEAFRKMFAHADIKVEHDISHLIPVRIPETPKIRKIPRPRGSTTHCARGHERTAQTTRVKQSWKDPLSNVRKRGLEQKLRSYPYRKATCPGFSASVVARTISSST